MSKSRDPIIFFAIAFGLTSLANQFPPIEWGGFNFNLLLCGCGPLLAGLICYPLLKTKNEIGISFLGTRPACTLLVCTVPLVTLYLTQSKPAIGVVLVYFIRQFAYCFAEEFGWRHYLQNATNSMGEWRQSFLIGLLWFGWHYSFLDDLSSQLLGTDMPALLFVPIMIVVLSLLSFLFGMMVVRSRSILFPTIGHLLFKTNGITMIVTGCVIAATLLLWDRLPKSGQEPTPEANQ